MENNSPGDLRFVRFGGMVLIGLFLICSFIPSSWNWGFSHLAFYGPLIRAAAIAIMLSVLLLAARPSWTERIERAMRQIHRARRNGGY